MKKVLFACLLAFLGMAGTVGAQALTWVPQYPTVDDTVVITYDPALGNGALNGVPVIYAHTGLITTLSNNLSDWQYRKTDWGDNDPATLMSPVAGNKFSLSIPLKAYYGSGSATNIEYMAFVFRDSTGSIAGKDANNGDFFIPIYPSQAFSARFVAPAFSPTLYNQNDNIDVGVSLTSAGSITIFHNGSQIANGSGNSLMTSLTASTFGKHTLHFEAVSGGVTYRDTIYYIVKPGNSLQGVPTNTRLGINYMDDTTVVLMLYAPFKSFAYVIGDFNDWELDPAYQMNQTPDGDTWWLEISGLTPGQEYRFQYFVDQDVRIPDPYTEKVLDQWNDPGISNTQTYPGLIPYPEGKTQQLVSVLETAQQPYNWQVSIPNFSRPWKEDLIIYELLIRDFIFTHDYKGLVDSLDYLQRLGINAIELMPFNEFDGNSSWGYGPALYFAPDKFYGPREDLKWFIDECHKRGIAVIMDIVLNHAFGQNPHVRLWYDEGAKNVTAQNPYFNTAIPHPFGFDFDFDHEAWQTEQLTDSIFAFWMKEYHIDGFRLDLSKGMTNTYTGSDLGLWGQYDQSRVDILGRLASEVWSRDPFVYLILEHLGGNTEEKALSDMGYMLWSKGTEEYNQATMGYGNNSDFEWAVSWKEKGWNSPKSVGFMESHDEERLMYKNIQFGNSDGGYDVRDLSTALQRMEMAGAFFFTVPGPKMIWQFGELGYDVSIDFPCRVCAKPIRWYYYTEPDRVHLFKVWKALIWLRLNNTAFRTANFDLDAGGTGKRMWVSDSQMNVCIIGNFDVTGFSMAPDFQHTGTWYDYLTGQPIQVNNTSDPIYLNPGEFHVYTDVQQPVPDLSVPTGVSEYVTNSLDAVAYPNPFADRIFISFNNPTTDPVKVRILNLMGQEVRTLRDETQYTGSQEVQWDGRDNSGRSLSAGYYLYEVKAGDHVVTGKLSLQR